MVVNTVIHLTAHHSTEGINYKVDDFISSSTSNGFFCLRHDLHRSSWKFPEVSCPVREQVSVFFRQNGPVEG